MNKEIIIPEERILTKIFLIRGEKVILDEHLPELCRISVGLLVSGAIYRFLKQISNAHQICFYPGFYKMLLMAV